MKTVSVWLSVVGILICSCATIDMDRTADLKKYKTFGWGESKLNVGNPAYKSELIDSNIKAIIQNEFASKGVVHVAKQPDLLVSYEGFTENKERAYTNGNMYYPFYSPFYLFYSPLYFPFPYFWNGPYNWGASRSSYSYTEGTLTIDLRDRKTSKLVWRGVVQGNVNDLKALNKNISKGIKAIMKKYPAAPGPLIPLPKDKVS